MKNAMAQIIYSQPPPRPPRSATAAGEPITDSRTYFSGSMVRRVTTAKQGCGSCGH